MSEVYADSIQAKVNGTTQAVPLRDSDAQEKIGSLSKEKVSAYNIVPGVYISNNGLPVNDTSRMSTEMIPCIEGQTVEFYGEYGNPYVSTITFYDFDGIPISVNAKYSGTVKEYSTITAPENSVTFKVSGTVSDGIGIIFALPNLKEYNSYLNRKNTIFDSEEYDVRNYFTFCTYEFSGGYYIGNSGKIEYSSTYTDITTNLFKLQEISDIYTNLIYTSYVIFYDENFNFLSKNEIYYDRKIPVENIPENSAYIRIQYNTASKNTIKYAAQLGHIYTGAGNTSNWLYGYREIAASTIKKLKGSRPKIEISSSLSEMEILYKMIDVILTGDCDVYFDGGTYTFDEVYTYLDSEVMQEEIPIGGNCKYFFNSSTFIAKCTNSSITGYNCIGSSRMPWSYEIYDGIFESYGGLYVLHDEGSSNAIPYHRVCKNCKFICKNPSYQIGTGSLQKCIGIGTSLFATTEYDSIICVDEIESDRRANISIHGVQDLSDAGYVKIIINNSFFDRGISLDNIGENQQGIAIITCNIFDVSKSNIYAPGSWDVYENANNLNHQ